DIKSEAGAGILLHYSSNGIHISKVYTTGKIESSGQYIGGIAGRLYESDIEQSYSRASVSGDARIGGLVGEAGSTTTITNSYATGPVLSDDTEGGLVAVGSIHTVNNSFWNTETTNQISSKGGGTGLTTTEMHDADEYTDWDFDDVWAMDAGENDGYPYLRAAYFAGGAGTEADPFEISNVYHLQNMKDHLEAHFIVINDIDASVTENWNDGEGWEPIGNGDDPFVGSLDGGGFPIKNLYINREEENPIGLFGEAGDGSILTNIGLEDAHISGRSAVGALAGNNRGDISNVYVTDVDISSVANVLGGLVGGNYGEISSSYTTGEVNSEGDDIGGLAGYLFEGAINNSYANVAVTSTGSRGVGGLVGWNHVNSTVNNSYSLGAVEGAEEFGGLIGRIRDGGVVTNSFWDTEKSGNADSDGGEGKSTAEMNAIATFTDAGWDFDDMWDF
ncbi:MAG: GLUG motif-containing protein, partial [Balneolales bacterium]